MRKSKKKPTRTSGKASGGGLTARQAAKALGISHVALLKAAKAGRISGPPWDVEECKRRLAETSRKGDNTLAEAARQLEWLKVRQRELEVKVREGELVPVGEINAWMAGKILRAKDLLLRIGPENRDLLAQTSDPVECERIVTAEVDRALRELAKPLRPAGNSPAIEVG